MGVFAIQPANALEEPRKRPPATFEQGHEGLRQAMAVPTHSDRLVRNYRSQSSTSVCEYFAQGAYWRSGLPPHEQPDQFRLVADAHLRQHARSMLGGCLDRDAELARDLFIHLAVE